MARKAETGIFLDAWRHPAPLRLLDWTRDRTPHLESSPASRKATGNGSPCHWSAPRLLLAKYREGAGLPLMIFARVIEVLSSKVYPSGEEQLDSRLHVVEEGSRDH